MGGVKPADGRRGIAHADPLDPGDGPKFIEQNELFAVDNDGVAGIMAAGIASNDGKALG